MPWARATAKSGDGSAYTQPVGTPAPPSTPRVRTSLTNASGAGSSRWITAMTASRQAARSGAGSSSIAAGRCRRGGCGSNAWARPRPTLIVSKTPSPRVTPKSSASTIGVRGSSKRSAGAIGSCGGASRDGAFSTATTRFGTRPFWSGPGGVLLRPRSAATSGALAGEIRLPRVAAGHAHREDPVPAEQPADVVAVVVEDLDAELPALGELQRGRLAGMGEHDLVHLRHGRDRPHLGLDRAGAVLPNGGDDVHPVADEL